MKKPTTPPRWWPSWPSDALVPDDAVRGDVVPITVSLTNALGTDEFDASFRIVGPKKPRRH